MYRLSSPLSALSLSLSLSLSRSLALSFEHWQETTQTDNRLSLRPDHVDHIPHLVNYATQAYMVSDEIKLQSECVGGGRLKNKQAQNSVRSQLLSVSWKYV